jgi:hypothetical protein
MPEIKVREQEQEKQVRISKHFYKHLELKFYNPKRMVNLQTVFLFLFVTSTVMLSRYFIIFLISLLSTNPKKIEYTTLEIVLIVLSISYSITFLIESK